MLYQYAFYIYLHVSEDVENIYDIVLFSQYAGDCTIFHMFFFAYCTILYMQFTPTWPSISTLTGGKVAKLNKFSSAYH